MNVLHTNKTETKMHTLKAKSYAAADIVKGRKFYLQNKCFPNITFSVICAMPKNINGPEGGKITLLDPESSHDVRNYFKEPMYLYMATDLNRKAYKYTL